MIPPHFEKRECSIILTSGIWSVHNRHDYAKQGHQFAEIDIIKTNDRTFIFSFERLEVLNKTLIGPNSSILIIRLDSSTGKLNTAFAGVWQDYTLERAKELYRIGSYKLNPREAVLDDLIIELSKIVKMYIPYEFYD